MTPSPILQAEKMIHKATQLLAWTTHHYKVTQPDDSQNNLSWDPKKRSILSRVIENGEQPFALGLRVDDLQLQFWDAKGQVKEQFPVAGKPIWATFSELMEHLQGWGLKLPADTFRMHYELPEWMYDESPVLLAAPNVVAEWVEQRTLANEELAAVNAYFSSPSEIRIWPHHFDTGGYYPVGSDPQGNTNRSVGTGWAVADAMVEEPYFYIYGWHKEQAFNWKEVPLLEDIGGKWMVPEEGWQGAVLPNSALQKLEKQEKSERVRQFFQRTIPFYQAQLS